MPLKSECSTQKQPLVFKNRDCPHQNGQKQAGKVKSAISILASLFDREFNWLFWFSFFWKSAMSEPSKAQGRKVNPSTEKSNPNTHKEFFCHLLQGTALSNANIADHQRRLYTPNHAFPSFETCCDLCLVQQLDMCKCPHSPLLECVGLPCVDTVAFCLPF